VAESPLVEPRLCVDQNRENLQATFEY